MSIVPDVDVSDSSKDADNDADTAVYAERMDAQEEYWAAVECFRAANKMLRQHDIAVQDNGSVFAKEAENESPLAALGVQLYLAKDEQGSELTEQRKSGDLDDEQNLPNYKDQFGTPEWDHTEVTADNAEELGVDSEHFDDDETLFVPDDFSDLIPTKDNGSLKLYYDTDTDSPEPATVSKEAVLESLNDTEGIGKKTAGKALNQLEADGIIETDE